MIEKSKEVEFTTDSGTHVTVRSGRARIVNEEEGIDIDRTYSVEERGGKKCLYVGTRETSEGIEKMYVSIEDHKDEIERLHMPDEVIETINDAIQSGEEQRINSWHEGCNDPSEECDLDHVVKVPTSEGETETRRYHTG